MTLPFKMRLSRRSNSLALWEIWLRLFCMIKEWKNTLQFIYQEWMFFIIIIILLICNIQNITYNIIIYLTKNTIYNSICYSAYNTIAYTTYNVVAYTTYNTSS